MSTDEADKIREQLQFADGQRRHTIAKQTHERMVLLDRLHSIEHPAAYNTAAAEAAARDLIALPSSVGIPVQIALLELLHSVRLRVVAELGETVCSELETEVIARIKAVSPSMLDELVHECVRNVRRVQAELAAQPEPQAAASDAPASETHPDLQAMASARGAPAAPASEEGSQAPHVEPPMTHATDEAPAATEPGPDLAAMASARSGGAPAALENPEENAAAVSASGAAPAGE